MSDRVTLYQDPNNADHYSDTPFYVAPTAPPAPPEVAGLPPLHDDCNEDDVHLRAERCTVRVFDIIDDGDAADGDAPNHAGIDAEWDLIQRERQLSAEIAAHAQTKAALAEAQSKPTREDGIREAMSVVQTITQPLDKGMIFVEDALAEISALLPQLREPDTEPKEKP